MKLDRQHSLGKWARAATAAALAGGLAFGANAAFAKGTGSQDNGGNGEGKLYIYSSLSAAQNAKNGKGAVSALTAGQTYYIVLANPGGKTKEKNLKNVPTQLDFEFYNPPQNFQGNPAKANNVPIGFTVANAPEDGTGSPYIYTVTIPSSTKAGNYSIATFGSNPQPQSNGKEGEDEFFFSTDPLIDGGNGIPIQSPLQNQMPEIPLAGAIPAGLAVIGSLVWWRQRAK